MGSDAKTSVLNRYCQTHDVDNLFVLDTSAFVTFPGHNPSLTAQALAVLGNCVYRPGVEGRGVSLLTKQQ